MTDSISDMMFAAAVTLAEQAAVAAMNRDAAYARHVDKALRLVTDPPVADREPGLTLVEDGSWPT